MTDEEWDKRRASLADLLYENGVDHEEVDAKATNWMNTNYGPRPRNAPDSYWSELISISFDERFDQAYVGITDDDKVLTKDDLIRLHGWTTEIVDYFNQHAEV